MVWEFAERPGQTGFKGKDVERRLNETYGEGRWRKVWVWEGDFLHKADAFGVCEEAYFQDSLKRENVWRQLLAEASEVYDINVNEINSGTNYAEQLNYTRFHDICIRRVLERRGWKFTGNRIVQIRYNAKNGDLGYFSENFDPGKVIFHKPESIVKPNLEGWWGMNSVEDFYQSNKIIQRRLE